MRHRDVAHRDKGIEGHQRFAPVRDSHQKPKPSVSIMVELAKPSVSSFRSNKTSGPADPLLILLEPKKHLLKMITNKEG